MVVQKKCRSSFIYSRVSNLSLPQVYDVLFKDSLNIYRPKNSRIIDIEAVKSEQSAPKKGAIFVVQNKQHFRPSGTRGIIVTSRSS